MNKIWRFVEHNWSDTSIYCGEKIICTLSIRDEATEETQEECEKEMYTYVSFIVNACNEKEQRREVEG